MRHTMQACLLAGTAICFLISSGCGGDDPMAARPDIAEQKTEDLYGASVKGLLYEFRAKVRRRGVVAAKQELPLLIENMENYEQQPLGTHAATYKEIVDKLKALESSLGSASKDAVVKAANEIGTLADKLPGKANENPQVD